MKKIIYITLCCIAIFVFSSCRSTSKPCGLANIDIKKATHITIIDHELANNDIEMV